MPSCMLVCVCVCAYLPVCSYTACTIMARVMFMAMAMLEGIMAVVLVSLLGSIEAMLRKMHASMKQCNAT